MKKFKPLFVNTGQKNRNDIVLSKIEELTKVPKNELKFVRDGGFGHLIRSKNNTLLGRIYPSEYGELMIHVF